MAPVLCCPGSESGQAVQTCKTACQQGAFTAVNNASHFSEEDVFRKSLLRKWDLYGKLQFQVFSYSSYYPKLQYQELVHDLFNDAAFQSQLKVVDKRGTGQQLQGKVSNIKVAVVPATETRLDMFDRLLSAEPPIVRGNGSIVKCMHDPQEGFEVSDVLRQMLLCEDSDHAELFSSEEKQQLLWRLFQLVCLGSPCCQFEDQLQPYLEVVKGLYKTLLSVQKSATTGKLEVTSPVLEVKSWDAESGLPLFPCPSRNNLCLVAVDPLRRLVKVVYHAFVPYW